MKAANVVSVLILALASVFTGGAGAAQNKLGRIEIFTTWEYGPFPLPAETYAIAYAFDNNDSFQLYGRLYGCSEKFGRSDFSDDQALAYFERYCYALKGIRSGTIDLNTRSLYFPFEHRTDTGSSTRSERLAGHLGMNWDERKSLVMDALAEISERSETRGLPRIRLDFSRVVATKDVAVPRLPAVRVIR